jgi:hypothetical protein
MPMMPPETGFLKRASLLWSRHSDSENTALCTSRSMRFSVSHLCNDLTSVSTRTICNKSTGKCQVQRPKALLSIAKVLKGRLTVILCPLSSNSSQSLYIAKMWLGAPGRGMAIIREPRQTQGQPTSTAPIRRIIRTLRCMLYPVLVLTILNSS